LYETKNEVFRPQVPTRSIKYNLFFYQKSLLIDIPFCGKFFSKWWWYEKATVYFRTWTTFWYQKTLWGGIQGSNFKIHY